MGSALILGSIRIKLYCRAPSCCLQKTGELLDAENPHVWCQKCSVGRRKFSPLVGIREVGFARTVLAHGNMWFGKGKEGRTGMRNLRFLGATLSVTPGWHGAQLL